MHRATNLLIATLTLACAGEPDRPADAPERTASSAATSNLIRTERWPGVPVRVDSAFRPLGSRTIELGAGSVAEIHVLADVSEAGNVRRFYWVQFEGKSPGSANPYDYSSLPHRDTIDGYPFFTGVRFGAYTDSEIEDEPDTGTVGAILAEHGYDFPAPMMRVRMVTLDESRRNELLVIYMEALEWSGTALEELEADEAAWAEASAGLRERATGGLGLVPGG